MSKVPTAEDKINGLASTLSDYEAKIQGKESQFPESIVVSAIL